MTYRGNTKQTSSAVDAMDLYEQRHEPYIRNRRKEEYRAQREKLYAKNAPKNPVQRFFYNLEKKRLG